MIDMVIITIPFAVFAFVMGLMLGYELDKKDKKDNGAKDDNNKRV